jgi:hypothetical protein
MTTPTYDEIKREAMRLTKQELGERSDLASFSTYHNHLIRLAREGLPVPVKDDAVTLFNLLADADEQKLASGTRIATIRTFLAERDAERDEAVAELVEVAKRADHYARRVHFYDDSILNAALAKLERK